MKAAGENLKQEFKAMDLDELEDLQDDMAELMEQNEEIQEIMYVHSLTFGSFAARVCIGCFVVLDLTCSRMILLRTRAYTGRPNHVHLHSYFVLPAYSNI